MRCDRSAMRKWLTGMALGAIVFAFVGCSSSRYSYLPADGVPDDQYLVGGGLMIDWKAPSAGTAYLVEKETGKLIETRSMEAGDNFGFSVASTSRASDRFSFPADPGSQARIWEDALGIPLSEARLLLYFQPLATKGSVL